MIIIVIIILLLCYINKTKTEKDKIKYYDFGNKNSDKKICILAGVHGNEPAGCHLLINLLKKNYFNKFNLYIRVIPVVNEFGIKYNIRYQNNLLYPDINRNFREDGGIENISKQLVDLTKKFNIIIDFHEAWGYYKDNNGSIGSTISTNMTKLGNIIIDKLNRSINDKRKQFIQYNKLCRIKTSFGCFNKNKKYMLVETSGQNNIQPLKLRMKQIYIIIKIILENINII